MSAAKESLWSIMVSAGVLLVFVTHAQPASGQPASAAPRIVAIEGQFGKVEVNVTAPSLTGLYLRGPHGLSEKSDTGFRRAGAVLDRRLHLRARAGPTPLRKPAGQAGKG